VIQRTILLRLRPDHRAGAADLGARTLALLLSRPMVVGAEVAAADPLLGEGTWDLAVTVRLRDLVALRAYEADPVHAAFVRDVLTPCVAERTVAVLAILPAPGA
jgi:hypothetical protein